MVAKIIHGKSIRAVLSYNEKKLRNCEAELLLAAGFPQYAGMLSFKEKLERFHMLTRQNERTRTNTLHIILGFSVLDKLDNNMLQSIALQYMEGIGFGEQPFLLYRHYDTHNPHLHIATVNIAPGGGRIETHNIGKNQSNTARKLLEELYGLVRAEDQLREQEYSLQPVRLEKIKYGKSATKVSIATVVREVMDTYKFTSLPEYNTVLRQFNVMAYRGTEDSLMFQKGGLVYFVLDENGQRGSVPIKASSLFFSPTLKNLEKKYDPNMADRKPLGLRLKHQLEKALLKAKSLLQLKEMLEQQDIRILLRLSAQGEVYGATFIDNATRCVFNGSDLGKPFAAKAFMEGLSQKGITLTMIECDVTGPDKGRGYMLTSSDNAGKQVPKWPGIELLRDKNTTEAVAEDTVNRSIKKKKKLGME